MVATLILFLFILSLLVYVHELGHFIFAKLNGVKVWEFALGFKPRLWAKKIGETTYAINALPIGGYVRLHGEEESEKGPDSFRSKTIFQRFQILFGGVLMNMMLAWVILTLLFAVGFDPLMPDVDENPFVTGHQRVEVLSVASQSPAEQAKLRGGDVVKAVEGVTVRTSYEFITEVAKKRGGRVDLTIERNQEERSVQLEARENPPAGEGALGVEIRSTGEVKSSLVAAPAAALYETGRLISLSVQGLGQFVKNLVVKQKVSEEVTGIIGVGALTGATRRLGVEYVAQLVAVVSVGLAVVNLMPILPLDGGHILLLGYEKIAGRPLSEKKMSRFAMLGIIMIAILFFVVTYVDLVRFEVLERLL